jgi:hypothetical protein
MLMPLVCVVVQMLLTPEELREKLKVVRTEPALVVMLVDLLDASGSFLGEESPPLFLKRGDSAL